MTFSFQISRHKYFEFSFQFLSHLCQWFETSFRYREKTDHSGLYIVISLFKLFFLELNIYDNRHWNSEENRYLLPHEETPHYDNVYGCERNKLTKSFNYITAENLLKDLLHIQPRVNAIFKDINHPIVKEHYKEIGGYFKDLEDWVRALL